MLALRLPRTIASRRRTLGVFFVIAAFGIGSLLLPVPAAAAPSGSVTQTGLCPGSPGPSHFSGQLTLEGGPLPSSVVAGVNLSYSYSVESVTSLLSNGTHVAEECFPANGTVTTQADGTFAFSVSAPGENCSYYPPFGEACTTYTAPYGPMEVSVTTATPAGYGLSSTSNGSVFSLAWVADLASVTVTPSGSPVVASTSAPTAFLATPWTANGTASSLSPSFDWALNGSGWSFVAPPGSGGSATLVAAPGATPGNLTVQAIATVGSNSFETPVLTVPLQPVATTLNGGTVNLTAVDSGTPVGVVVTATGAEGYAYRATVVPGLGLASTTMPCASRPDPPSSVTVRCSTTLSYPVPGIAEPSVVVSNGYSAAVWAGPNVTVDPASALELSPSAPVGYAGTPISITVAVAPGTGVPPFELACLEAVGAGSECQPTAGPSWTFRPTFSSPANYSATASVLDAAGVNRSVPLTVEVVAPLTLSSVTSSSSNVSAGTAVVLSSFVTGGRLPAEVWWNSSGSARPLATYPVATDGPTSFEYTPATVGSLWVSLTVRDALGTVVEANRTLSVIVGPATEVVAAGGATASPVVVGTPVPLAWQALGAANEPDPGFAATAVLSISGPAGSAALAWANVTGAEALSSAPEGSFVIPSTAWVGGELRLTLTPVTAGTLTVTLGGPGVPGPVSETSVVATDDPAHLRLFNPTVVLPGDRANHTFWRVADRFGNSVPDAYVIVQYLLPGRVIDQLVGVGPAPGGGTGVWVNYTLPASGGTVDVLDAAGELLLPPIRWTEASSAALPDLATLVLLLGATAGLGVGWTAAKARRRGSALLVPDEEEAARELAEGRATLVELVRTAGTIRWEVIEDAWVPPPAPPELGEWLASLLADGTVLGRATPDGSVEYRLAPAPPEAPHVTVDALLIDRAVARREAAVRGEEEDHL